jgi:predicted HicB family RNase H-like nuclease
MLWDMSNSSKPPRPNYLHFSFRLPEDQAEIVVRASIDTDQDLNKWVGRLAVLGSAAQLGIPAPLPAYEAPDHAALQRAAEREGITIAELEAKALRELVSRILGENATSARKPSGVFDLKRQTPAEAVRAGRGRS